MEFDTAETRAAGRVLKEWKRWASHNMKSTFQAVAQEIVSATLGMHIFLEHGEAAHWLACAELLEDNGFDSSIYRSLIAQRTKEQEDILN